MRTIPMIVTAIVLAACGTTVREISEATETAPATVPPTVASAATASPPQTAALQPTTDATVASESPGSAGTPTQPVPAPAEAVFVGPSTTPLPGGGGADGSGCEPGSDVLADGVWFGFAIDHGPGSIEFDLACFYSDEELANAKAAEDGETDLPLPNPFYIRNHNPKTRSLTVADGATVSALDASVETVVIPYGDWPIDGYSGCQEVACAIWVYVNGGVATELVEQYLP